MALMHHNEAQVDIDHGQGCAQLWRIQGPNGYLQGFWPNKLAAEVAARAFYPTAAAELGTNALVSFVRFYPEMA